MNRSPSRRTKLNPKMVSEMSGKGLTQVQVAKALDISDRTVRRYLNSLDVKSNQLQWFKDNKADILSDLQAIAHDKRLMVLDTVEKEDVVLLDAKQRVAMARDLSVIAGIDHDHERMERGQAIHSQMSVNILIHAADGSKQAIQVQALTPQEQIKSLEYNEGTADTQSVDVENEEPSKPVKRRRGRPRKGGEGR